MLLDGPGKAVFMAFHLLNLAQFLPHSLLMRHMSSAFTAVLVKQLPLHSCLLLGFPVQLFILPHAGMRFII